MKWKIYFKPLCFLLLIILQSGIVRAQNRDVRGQIKDEEGRPIASASVVIKGTTIGTSSDSSGYFSIAAPATAKTLIISNTGFKEIETTLPNSNVVNVTLVRSNDNLGEVVVIGYGSVKKTDLTSSVTKINAKAFNKGPFQSVDQLIQGKVPGLTITRNGNDPNGNGSFVLRGIGSLTGNSQPFFVIDGVPAVTAGVIYSIPPEDIASIDVLKDAAATAIYGTRGANGVIVVTTKRAKPGQMYVNYSATVGLESISNRYRSASADELRSFVSKHGETMQPQFDDGANTDWLKVITRNAWSNNHNISFGSGTATAKYVASLNYFKQDGVLKTTGIDRLTARLAADFNTADNKLRLGLQLNQSISNSQIPINVGGTGMNPLFQASTFLPTLKVYNDDGSYRETPGLSTSYNPLALLELYHQEQKLSVFSGTATAGVTILPNLTYDISLTFQKDYHNGKAYIDDEFVPKERLVLPNAAVGNTLFHARRYEGYIERKLLETYLTYTKEIKNVKLRALAGYSWQNDYSDGFGAGTVNLISNSVGANNLALSNPPPGYNGITASVVDVDRLISFFGRAEAGIDDRYLLTLSFRRDGSNKFGTNNQWANFPAASIGWRISNEDFMKNSTIFDELKLRIGAGSSGEKNLPNYASVYRYTNSGYNYFYFNGDFIPAVGYNRSFNPNPDLKWQTTFTVNAGVDFSMLDGKLSGSLDLYNKTSKDLLFLYTVNKNSMGPGGLRIFDREFANVGRIENKGIELQLNASIIRKRNLTYSTSLAMAYNKNKVVSATGKGYQADSIQLAEIGGLGLSGINTHMLYAGGEVGAFYLFDWVGSDKSTGKQIYRNHKGELVNGNQLSAGKDQKIMGSPIPKFTVGLTNNFTYKQFDLSVFLRGQFGAKILNVAALQIDRDPKWATNYNIAAEFIDDLMTEQPVPSSKYLESGNFVRIDNVTLGYNFRNVHPRIKTMRVYASVINLAVFTKYKGVDPEISLAEALSAGNDFNHYPKTRTASIGFNIGL